MKTGNKTRKKIKRLIQYYFLFLFIANGSVAQETSSKFPQQNLINANPSFAGSNGLLRFQGSMNADGITATNSSGYFYKAHHSADAYLEPIGGAIAVSHEFRKIKNFNESNFYSVSYAQHINFKKPGFKLIPSASYSYMNSLYDAYLLPWVSQYKVTYKGIGGGLLFNKKGIYAGVSVNRFSSENTRSTINTRSINVSTYFSYNFFHEDILLHFYLKNRINTIQQYNSSNSAQSLSSAIRFSIQIGSNLLLFKHLLLGTSFYSGVGISTNIGYRFKYATIALAGNVDFNNFSNQPVGGITLNYSYNLRPKTTRNEITNIEAW